MLTSLVFTDVAGSTLLAARNPAAFARALRLHFQILRSALVKHGGEEFLETGDGLCLAFSNAAQAERFALEVQEGLAIADWPEEIGGLRIRVGLHCGEVVFREGQYRGLAMNVTARLLSAAHGGQTLCSGDFYSSPGVIATNWRRLGAYRLRGLEGSAEIFQLDGGETFPPLRVSFARRHNLPAANDEFVGREREVREVTELLMPTGTERLVSLTGPGGIGKTRLALSVADVLLVPYEHGVVFVPLADLSEARGIPFVVLDALGIIDQDPRDPVGQIVSVIKDSPTLLVFDNIEHLSAEGAAMLDRLGQALPSARFLVTSRSRLGLTAEREFPVEALGIPGERTEMGEDFVRCAAVQFFLKKAGRVRQDFTLGERNAASVAGICRMLDGVPLALELAAARIQVMTAEELFLSLQADFANFHNARHALDGRLEQLFDWSWRLLPPDIASFLSVLSVFRGGWTAETSAAVAGLESRQTALAFLHYLLTCSLIRVAESSRGMRFAMLEPVRQMASVRLAERRAEIIGRHGEYFCELARKVEEGFGTDREELVVAEIDPEVENIFAALEGEKNNAKRLHCAGWFQQYAVTRTCNRRLRELLVRLDPEGGEVKPGLLARSWTHVMALDSGVGDFGMVVDSHRMAVKYFEESDEEVGIVSARFNLGEAMGASGRYEEALQISLETLAYFRQRQAAPECVTILHGVANNCRRLQRFEEAEQHVADCLGLCELIGSNSQRAIALCNLGEIRLEQGDWTGAIPPLRESLAMKISLGDELSLADPLIPLSSAAGLSDDYATAAFLAAAVRAMSQRNRKALLEEYRANLEATERRCRAELGPAAWQQCCAEGAKASPAQILKAVSALTIAERNVLQPAT